MVTETYLRRRCPGLVVRLLGVLSWHRKLCHCSGLLLLGLLLVMRLLCLGGDRGFDVHLLSFLQYQQMNESALTAPAPG